jgi:hypothetical protein
MMLYLLKADTTKIEDGCSGGKHGQANVHGSLESLELHKVT